jgi:hypothetical protein
MTRRKESLPLLRGHGIAFNLLNSLAYTFINRSEVTPELVEAALTAFHLDPDCDWFRTIYTTADRAVGHTKKRSAPSASSAPAAEGNSHDRSKKNMDTKSYKQEKKKNPCFQLNSTAGCPRSDCHFSHVCSNP